MAISTVNVDFSAILQNAATATGLLRVRLSQVGTVEDSETGDRVILPITWQETTLTDGAATLALVPNKVIEPPCTYYEIQLKSVPDCPKACAKLLLSGIMYVPDEDCNVLDLLISPPSPETANTASGYASQAKQAAQVAENFAVQAGDRYDDVAEAAATALTDIGTAKQDALDAIGTAQSGATEAISTAQGTAIGAVQAEGNTQVGRVEDAGEDAVADVTAAQDAAVSAVQAQQATSIVAVTAEGTRQTGLVTAEGTAQVNAVTQAGNGYVATMQGLVSDAQAARDAAQTAQGLAEDAQTAAESASTDAQGYAGNASTSAGQAAQSASDAADSATAAQASADSIAASAAQIQTNADNITALETKTDITNKNVENILLLLDGTVYRKETDNIAAYSKTVPTSALRWASMDMIGGKTVAWNQKYNITRTTGATRGVSAEVANGVVTLSGTANGTGYGPILAWTDFTFPAGHKVIIQKDFALPSGSYIIEQYNAPGITDATAVVITISASNQYVIPQVYVVSGTNYDGISGHLMVIDLTLMFGAGNEPTTVEQFRAMFPASYYPYNAGELRSAGVTEVESEGKNLFNFSAVTGGESAGGTSQTIPLVYNSQTGHYTCGFSLGSYGRRFMVFGDEYLEPGTYTISVSYKFSSSTSTDWGLVLGLGDGTNSYYNVMQAQQTGSQSYTITLATRQRYRVLIMPSQSGSSNSEFWDIQVEKASTATSYSPYFSTAYPVPAAVQALPGYGWSAGTVYNYIDFERKVYVQRVGSIVLNGTQTIQTANWRPGTDGVGWIYPYNITQNKVFGEYVVSNIVSNSLQAATYHNLYGKTALGIGLYTSTASGLVIRQPNTSLIDSTTINAYLAENPITVYYELATPIETDISSLLTDSTIEVEPGGTITFENQHGDDFRLPVPNEETFLVQATPELPTTDGTYTLTATVTDGEVTYSWESA